jgi:hypothetical protein
MSFPTISGLLKFCAGLYVILIVIDWWKVRRFKLLAWELVFLLGLVLLDVFLVSSQRGYVSFGPDGSSLWTVLIMFCAVALGVAARYIFYLRGSFSWLDFAKPLCISPILLLPLIGSLQSVKSLEPMQIVSFGLLAFQNGFFWQAVLQKARPKT